jgi:hypothetical protein
MCEETVTGISRTLGKAGQKIGKKRKRVTWIRTPTKKHRQRREKLSIV